jgi:hypothetical protein
VPKLKQATVTLDYSNYILQPPGAAAPAQLRKSAEANDQTTIDFWREKWVANIKANKERFGSFAERSVGKLFQKHLYGSVIVAGSGPSLKKNGPELKDRGGVPLVSCLHNFHYFEDLGVDVDYYVTLDAGEVTIEEVSEGGSKSADEYWALTKNRKLLAYIGTHPKLLEKWQGEIYFYNCQIPNLEIENQITAIEKFWIDFSVGGNVLGACVYAAKAIFGAATVAFVGADFAFSYDKKFHGWDSKYDANLGQVLRSIDVFGNSVLTWPSYHGFKCFFEWMAQVVPGFYVNCTEGGTLGAFAEGNLVAIRQMDLCDFLGMLRMSENLRANMERPAEVGHRITLY